MKVLIRLFVFVVIVFILPALPAKIEAAFFDTLDKSLDAMPASVIVANNNENFAGKTTSGEDYFQYRIVSDPTVRIHKFTLGSLKFYISDQGVFSADDDLQALSIYFSLV